MNKILARNLSMFLSVIGKRTIMKAQGYGLRGNKLASSCLRISVFVFSALLLLYTSSAWSATISGNVAIEGRSDLSGVLVTVQEESLSGITSDDGAYSIQNVPQGSYTLVAQKPGCLVKVHSDVVVGNESVAINIQLIPGDLKIDNQINLLDRIMLTSAWKAEKGKPNWNSLLDIHEDGIIDEKDRDLLLSHWRKGNPSIELGSLEVVSEPEGANILINGADTEKTTPHTFRGMVKGSYTIMLVIAGYDPRETVARVRAWETSTLDPSPFILDNEPPEFADWTQDPADLTEDAVGRLRVSVRVVDKGGSGLGENIPQFSYRIGSDVQFSQYEDMTSSGGDLWYFDIPEPAESWNAYRGQFIRYKARIEDVAGNVRESDEQEESVNDINDPPTVRITSAFDTWESGLLAIAAEASDTDGTIDRVRFEYSLDNTRWIQIGSTVTVSPYSVTWNTAEVVREVAGNVWIRATATDDDDDSGSNTTASFAIDNQPPVTDYTYDGEWHNEDFDIILEADDKNGIGVASISYELNFGNEQNVPINGQPSVPVRITKENHDNILEYWSTDKLGNAGSRKRLSNIKLDKTAPTFAGWIKEPDNLTEDSMGTLRVSVSVSDGDGSGLEGRTPQIDYSIGQVPQYDGYADMATDDGKVWHFDIPEPTDTWNAHRGEFVYYKVTSTDVAENTRESAERSEWIDDINDLPEVDITSGFNAWERGLLTIEAEASDTDGTIAEVQFEYSPDDGITWELIGSADTTAPFLVAWDTIAAIPQAQSVRIRATTTDDSDGSTSSADVSVGIDNQAPVTMHDYDNLWHTVDFAINLTVSDGGGIGVSNSNVKYRINDGDEKNLDADDQPWIAEEGLSQLEYWSVDNLENEESHHILRNIKLDRTEPTFRDWIEDPSDLSEDTSGPLQVSVRVEDTGGSGLVGQVAQLSYRIGKATQYSPFEDMTKSGTDDIWYFDIPEPIGSWDAQRGKEISYKAMIMDVAGNLGESAERKVPIADINDPPIVVITSTFNEWEKGSLTIQAEASDIDGIITGVQFEYGPNRVNWKPIGGLITIPPYSITWNTKISIPGVEEVVWIRATAYDDDGDEAKYTRPRSMSIDNQPPITTDDYRDLWHNADFFINLTSGDRDDDGDEGIGVARVLYRFNFGAVQEVPMNGQATVPVKITTEGADNVLEYWSVDKLGNEGTHQTITGIKLDKTAPVFSGWEQDPVDLTEDTVGRFRVSVQVTDTGGSGLEGKAPEIDYHIGIETPYDGYKNMTGVPWFFDIPEPSDTWDAHQDQNVHYKVRIQDIAGNVTETVEERLELIDGVNDEPVVSITSTFDVWEGEEITIKARASDVDGSTPIVQFEYSFDATDWMLVGVTSATPPVYSIKWNTKAGIPEVERTVWIKAKAIDADDTSVSVEVTSESFGVDNQSPTLGDWMQIPEDLTENSDGSFRVQVNVDDGIGSGVTKVELAYRIGNRIVRPFNEMIKGSGNSWYFDIREPSNTWDAYRGETLFYSAVATDAVGNESLEVPEQQELIENINDAPRGVITSTFDEWELGTITIMANAIDDDGEVASVQFQYSSDNINWINIGPAIASIPYITSWNTTVINMDPDVWIRIVITDNDGLSTQVPYIRSIGIDNTVPTFSAWSHTNLTEDSIDTFFRVEVTITDQGSGVDGTKVQVRYRIGMSGYGEYINMLRIPPSNVWFYEILRPSPWNNFAGETLFYRVRAADIAGNVTESAEQRELIEATTGSISGTISPRESWQFGNAKVKAIPVLPGGQEVEVPVSAQNGSYSITGLHPGLYDLEVTSQGYGIDRTMTNIQVTAGQDSPGHDVTLYTYTVAELIRSQGGTVEYGEYRLDIGSNALGFSGKVVLGVSGKEPTDVPNPEVQLLGSSIGIGFEGSGLSGSIQLVMPRPSGISDGNAIMTFIYDGKAQSYRFVDRANISSIDTNITITIDPNDVWNFSDDTHNFNAHLSRTSDTVFYALITEFNEPQLSSSRLGILNPQIFSGRVSNYSQPNISVNDTTVALVIHGITSTPDDLVTLITALRALNYYDHVLVFNYRPNNSISSNGSFLLTELMDELPSNSPARVDIIAHGMGGLVARSAIVSGGDIYTGSLTMLGVPHGGVDEYLLRTGFADSLLKTQADPAWTYYRFGWRDMLVDSTFLKALNTQPGRMVNTHYYGIGASNAGAPIDNDDLALMASMDFTTGFPNLEQALTEAFEKVIVLLPAIEGPGFMSRTRHVAMLQSISVRNKVTAYLQGNSQNIQYERYDGDLIPGQQLVDTFTVELKNVGTETVTGVVGQLSTSSSFIRDFSGDQGIEDDTDLFGNILPDAIKSGTFSFAVSSDAATSFGEQITFELLITNSGDNSVSLQTFEVPIGGDIIKIALDVSDQKRVDVDVATDAFRPMNDGDPALEPGEIMSLGIWMENQSSGSIPSVTVTLRTTDDRVEGLESDGDPVDLVNTGLTFNYSTFSGGAIRKGTFQFMKVKDDSAQGGLPIHFTLEIKTAGIFFGSDEFDVQIGADIIVSDINVDRDLEPGGGPEDIRITLKNITSSNIEDIRLDIDPDESEVDIDENDYEFDLIMAGGTDDTDFETVIEADFSGYVLFTLEIRVDGVLINTDSFQYYFGKRTQYVTHWVDDDDDGDNDGIAEPGETVKLQIARWNPTDGRADNVEAILDTTDPAILKPMDEDKGDYNDIQAHQVADLDSGDEYEFTIANAGDISGTSDDLDADTLTLDGADWIPDALIGGTLNPNTGQASPAVVFEIIDNDETTITVNTAAADLTDVATAGGGDPFSITMPTDAADLTEFQREGQAVDFTLDVDEDEAQGQETFTMRIGGIIRYLSPSSYDDLLDTISDRSSLDQVNNNGNGIPEPGETIEIEVTLKNITRNDQLQIDEVDDVVGELDEIGDNDDDFDIILGDKRDFDNIKDGSTAKATYTVRIVPDPEGNMMTFELTIDGEIDGEDVELGIDIFTIPIVKSQ